MIDRMMSLVGGLLLLMALWVFIGFVAKSVVWLFCVGYGC